MSYYLWTGKAPVVVTKEFRLNKYRHAFLYDPFAFNEGLKWQVLFKGKLTRRAKNHMPKEFLMHLLLLGLSL
jgi:hypothetical protein